MAFGDWAGAGLGALNPMALIGTAAQMGGNFLNLYGQREQRNWEEKMANSAYQRSVADMNKAGLNPGLMFGSGTKADTPNVAPPTFNNPLDGITSAVNAAKTMRDIEAVGQQIENLKATQRNTDQDTINKQKQQSGYEKSGQEAEARIKAAIAAGQRDTATSAKTEAETPWQQVMGHLASHVLGWLESGDKKATEEANKLTKPPQDAPPERRKHGPTSAKQIEDYPGIDSGRSVPINRGSYQ